MYRSRVLGGLVITVLSFLPASLSTAATGKIAFEPFVFPDNVVINSTRDLALCLVNQGFENELIWDGDTEDHLVLMIPIGIRTTDLALGGEWVGCSTLHTEWTCDVGISPSGNEIIVTMKPSGTETTVRESDTICFNITDVPMNSIPGLALGELEQFIDSRRADHLLMRPLAVFKTE